MKMANQIDNGKLEKLIKEMDMGLVGKQERDDFLSLFKKSRLFMPVILSNDFFENIENSREGDVFTTTEKSGFDINFLTLNDGKKAVALFTSSGLMESTGLKSSAIAIFMSDLADMLGQAPERYSMISVNPFTDLSIDMPMDSFLNLFNSNDELLKSLNSVLNILKEKSQKLEKDYAFFLRSEDDFMKENAVDGIFVPDIPFNVSSKEDFHEDLTYLNVILMPKSTRILFVGNVVDDANFDTIIAPESEFKIVKEIDEYTTVWQCIAQPFYDE